MIALVNTILYTVIVPKIVKKIIINLNILN